MIIVVHKIKIDVRGDSGGEIKFGLQPGPVGCSTLSTSHLRLFESIVIVPTHGDSLAERVSDCSLKIRRVPITFVRVRPKLGSATERSAQARVKGVIDAAESEMGG